MRRNCQEQSGTDAKQSVELTRQGYSEIKNSDMSYIYQPNEGCAFLYFEKKGGIGENEAAHNVNGKKHVYTKRSRKKWIEKYILSKHDLATGSILKIYFLKRLLDEISLQESALETCVLIGTSCSSSQDPKPQKTRRRRR